MGGQSGTGAMGARVWCQLPAAAFCNARAGLQRGTSEGPRDGQPDEENLSPEEETTLFESQLSKVNGSVPTKVI